MSKRTKPRAILVTLYVVVWVTILFVVSHYAGFGFWG